MSEKSNITMPPEERIEDRSLEYQNGEGNVNFCHKRTWKAPFQEGYNGVVGKPTTKRISLLWAYGKTSQNCEVTTGH